MKILLKLDSSFFTSQQNTELYNNMIEIEWPLPFLPKKGEFFDFDSIVEKIKWPEFYKGLSWYIDAVDYEKINNIVTPILWLCGE